MEVEPISGLTERDLNRIRKGVRQELRDQLERLARH